MQTPPLIAVADDEDAVRRALQRLLTAMGFEVEGYPSGERLLASLVVRRPACVILDLHMPDGDGFMAMERLSALEPPVPVVVITGRDTPEARARVEKPCLAAYLRKPVDARVLLDAIARAIGAPPPT